MAILMITSTLPTPVKSELLTLDKLETTVTLVKVSSDTYLLLLSTEVSQFTDTGMAILMITSILPTLVKSELLTLDNLETTVTLVKEF
jgi:hypothetical protein